MQLSLSWTGHARAENETSFSKILLLCFLVEMIVIDLFE